MKEKLEARIKDLQAKLDRLQARHNQLAQEIQAVDNEFVRTQGAFEEACYQVKELDRPRGRGEAEKGGDK